MFKNHLYFIILRDDVCSPNVRLKFGQIFVIRILGQIHTRYTRISCLASTKDFGAKICTMKECIMCIICRTYSRHD